MAKEPSMKDPVKTESSSSQDVISPEDVLSGLSDDVVFLPRSDELLNLFAPSKPQDRQKTDLRSGKQQSPSG
jgi:hypothetical protein